MGDNTEILLGQPVEVSSVAAEKEEAHTTSPKGIKACCILTTNGGVLDLTCNGNGDTALDTDGTYSNSGGSGATNNGSEDNPGGMDGGQMGGRPAGEGGMGGPERRPGRWPQR